MAQVEKLLVFIASPSDVAVERRHVEKVISKLNRTAAAEKNVVLQVKVWEEDVYPEFGNDAQAVINRQIAEMSRYDVFVGIMWNRLGTPTARAESGTLEEFRRAADSLSLNKRPNIMFYFRHAPAVLNSQEQLEQRSKVLKFEREIQANGLTYAYKGPADFQEKFHDHMVLWLNERSRGEEARPTGEGPPAPSRGLVGGIDGAPAVDVEGSIPAKVPSPEPIPANQGPRELESGGRVEPFPGGEAIPRRVEPKSSANPSLESGLFGGLGGGGVAGIILAVLYYQQPLPRNYVGDPVGWPLLLSIPLFSMFASAVVFGFSQAFILGLRRAEVQNIYLRLVMNDVTMGALGGSVGGLLAGMPCGWFFIPRNNLVLDPPQKFVVCGLIGSVLVAMGTILYDFSGRRLGVARVLTLWLMFTVFLTMIGYVLMSHFQLDEYYLTSLTPERLGGEQNVTTASIRAGALFGLVAGSIWGLQNGSILFLFQLWERLAPRKA